MGESEKALDITMKYCENVEKNHPDYPSQLSILISRLINVGRYEEALSKSKKLLSMISQKQLKLFLRLFFRFAHIGVMQILIFVL